MYTGLDPKRLRHANEAEMHTYASPPFPGSSARPLLLANEPQLANWSPLFFLFVPKLSKNRHLE
ncbi:hypothetical protein M426DRAFT_221098 [Hypoxylon sp. CI-4A]|nr:hypothetical protein M426DRAFT_221098 [Hypoxylon sp. CI-4A]